jgi:hypothetical protein
VRCGDGSGGSPSSTVTHSVMSSPHRYDARDQRNERTYTADWSSGPDIAWRDEAGVDAKPILKAAQEQAVTGHPPGPAVSQHHFD